MVLIPTVFFVNGSHAITEEYALMGAASASYGNVSAEYYDLGDVLDTGGYLITGGDFKHYHTEFGVGRYKKLSRKGVFEMYTGGGYGKAYTSEPVSVNRYGNVFFQANVGARKWMFEFGAMGRVSVLYMDYIVREWHHAPRYYDFPAVSTQLGGVLRTGGRHMKFWFSPSITACYPFIEGSREENDLDFNEGTFYTRLNLSLGLNNRF